jgi:hypothetical protein
MRGIEHTNSAPTSQAMIRIVIMQYLDHIKLIVVMPNMPKAQQHRKVLKNDGTLKTTTLINLHVN